MRWMETIKLQSVISKEQTTEHELTVLSREVQKNPDLNGLRDARVSTHALVPGCFAFQLFWETDNPQAGGSPLGMSIVQSLKAFGLVDHSVWIEISE